MPELRKDPITGRWVIISTDRAKRPGDFSREHANIKGGAFCPFCPGNESKTPPEIMALPIVPKQVCEELDGATRYFANKERGIYCEITRQEREERVRVVLENQDFVTLAPYAPRFPFETWILPKRHESAFENSPPQLYENLARMLKTLLVRSFHVLGDPAYNLVIHTSPAQDPTNDHYHWHIEFMPKLTKTAGFEWGTGFYINPTPPEEAARFLREARVEETKDLASS